ncbi:hypothetical protein LXM60_04560 [Pandoraea sputorum]|uniref:MORN repeat-containing protein n=1 Tax=Pandoraea sputorum TaxID=93222 RepID=UPI001E2B549B|nr:hypothetical protein [Pandoraea sputorum]MCE4059482.1 hypothetical protein [Pandoraea sputorum]
MAHVYKRAYRAKLALAVASAVGLLTIVGNAHAEEGVFIQAEGPGHCKVWSDAKPEERSEWTSTWTGPCNKRGIADGPGVQEWIRNGVFSARFEGTLVNGKRGGVGVYTWASGARYEGPFVDDARTGKAKYYWPNGDFYEGDFIAGKRTGKGVYIWPDGKRFEGDFVDNDITGEGYQLEPNGNTYRGGWQKNQFSGYGVIIFAQDGSVRAGQFVNSKIVDGTDRAADGTLIATYSNGVRTKEASADSGPGVFSFVAGLLGAAAQGVASGGGRNAAQYQAAATALQAVSGTGSSGGGAMPMAQPVSTMTSAGNGNIGGAASGGGRASSNDPFAGRKATDPVKGCIDQVRIKRGADGWGGWYDYETGIVNKCGYVVNTAWCVTSLKGASDTAQCEKQYTGMYGLNPGQQSSLQADRFGELQMLSCKEPAMPLKIQWNGTRFTGTCYLPPQVQS